MAALAMAEALPAGQKTLGADKGYDTHDFVMELRALGITPARRTECLRYGEPPAVVRQSTAAPPAMTAPQ
jgi:hypothetical protein